MPKSLDPNFRIRMVLADDVGKSPEPAFFAKTLTLSGLSAVQSLRGCKDPSALVDALMLCLTGWEHMTRDGVPLEFNRQNVADVLNIDEVVQIIEFVTSGGRLSVEERKKSE